MDFADSFQLNSKYAFVIYDGNIYLKAESGEVIWIGGDDESQLYDDTKSFALEEAGAGGQIDIENRMIELSSEGSSLGSVYLSVPHVDNENIGTSTNKKFVCWAACVAMTANYMDGDSYTARDVYNTVSSSYSGSSLGSSSCVQYAYSNCVDTSFSYRAKAIKGDTVFTSLKNGAPVQIAISGTNTSGGTCYHAILITGLHLYSSQAVYTVDDPNHDDGVRSFIAYGTPDENISSISYLGIDDLGLTMTYDNWYRSYYVS